ncbi:MAG: hypothetical protein KJ072_07905, partial [Verrucomicrobia bacterium]|nr:hypothetical protein [Verrucomicrobiota bacterium]
MNRLPSCIGCLLALLLWDIACLVGQEAAGNVDGSLTWELGSLEPGQSARETVLFVMGANYEETAARLREARDGSVPATRPDPPAKREGAADQTVWIENDSTDFALQGPGHFFWESIRQSFKGAPGGQLSRFGWYAHYDGRRAGTPIQNHAPENL